MQSADIYRQIILKNGIEIIVRDFTRNYFGDYHLVRLEITCRANAGEGSCVGDAVSSPGVQEAVFRKVVEKMGVPSSDVEAAKESLVQNFIAHSLTYLSAPDFPAKLAASTSLQSKKVKHRYTENKA